MRRFCFNIRFQKKKFSNSSKSTLIISQNNFNEKFKMNIKFENNELWDLNKFNFNILMKSFSIDDKIFKKIIIYRNFMSQFNMYTNLHFNKITFKYVIFNNVIIFFDKNKHRYEFQIKKKTRFWLTFLIISKLIFCIRIIKK